MENCTSVVCQGDFGPLLAQRRKRVVELEEKSKTLKEKLRYLESLLPKDRILDECVESSCEKCDRNNTGALLDENDSEKCALRSIAIREKMLKDQIYEMEYTEETYRRLLKNIESDNTKLEDLNIDSENDVSPNNSEIKKRISRLEAYSKKFCTNLRGPKIDRVELSHEAELLSREIEHARKELGLDAKRKYSDECIENETYTNEISTEDHHPVVQINSENDLETDAWEDDLQNDKQQKYISESNINLTERSSASETEQQSSSSDDETCICDETTSGTDYTVSDNHSQVEFIYDDEIRRKSLDSCYHCSCKKIYKKRYKKFGGYRQQTQNPISIAECKCDLCAIRNIENSKSSSDCCESTFVHQLPENCVDVALPPEISKACKLEKLRENLERLKNENYYLKKILTDCECSMNDEIKNKICDLEDDFKIQKTDVSINDLIDTLKILQNKCRIKDGMIAALADELKRQGCEKQTCRILETLVNPELGDTVEDFDRSTLWKYLEDPSREYHRRCVSRSSQRKYRKNLRIGFIILLIFALSILYLHSIDLGPINRLFHSLPLYFVVHQWTSICASKFFAKILPGSSILNSIQAAYHVCFSLLTDPSELDFIQNANLIYTIFSVISAFIFFVILFVILKLRTFFNRILPFHLLTLYLTVSSLCSKIYIIYICFLLIGYATNKIISKYDMRFNQFD